MTQHLRYVKTAARCPDHIIPIFMLGGAPEAYEVSSGLASNRIVSMRLFKSGAKLTRESPTLLMPTIISFSIKSLLVGEDLKMIGYTLLNLGFEAMKVIDYHQAGLRRIRKFAYEFPIISLPCT